MLKSFVGFKYIYMYIYSFIIRLSYIFHSYHMFSQQYLFWNVFWGMCNWNNDQWVKSWWWWTQKWTLQKKNYILSFCCVASISYGPNLFTSRILYNSIKLARAIAPFQCQGWIVDLSKELWAVWNRVIASPVIHCMKGWRI